MLPLAAALSLSLLAPPASGWDRYEHEIDGVIHAIRAFQHEDGSYGSGLSDTCRVLDAFGHSPRRYTDLDGPFVRKAATVVAAAQPDPQTDALVVLALAGCLTPPLAEAREKALDRLAGARGPMTYERALALRTFRPDALAPAPPVAGDVALSCLLAEDPASIAAPAVTDGAAWSRWGRAALLRGLSPKVAPDAPQPAPDASLAELLAALETFNVLAAIDLPEAGAPAPDAAARPARVPAGQDVTAALERSWAFLESRQKDGTFGMDLPGFDGPEPGITALDLSATCWLAERLGRPRPEWVSKGLDYLVGLQKPDGAIAEYGLDVYTTSVAIEALLAGGRAQDRPVIERARQYLVAAQFDEGEGYSLEADPFFGGIGYEDGERPDLSNTQMALEAATRAGTPADDAMYRKALVFLERCQNLSERQAVSWPRLDGGRTVAANDGGAIYMPGGSQAGEVQAGEGLWQARSYGSMTYALVKSYLFCGVPADDARVQAAVRWLGRNFTVEHNPGFVTPAEQAQGLYYYYLALARTLRMLPEPGLTGPDGEAIDWRAQLVRKLLDEQRTDGSWINEGSRRWWEGAPTLSTPFALLALAAAGA